MRFNKWKFPKIEDGKPTKYNWVVQHIEKFELRKMTDIGAFTYINARYGVIIEEGAQVGSHCSIYSESTIDGKRGKVHIKANASLGTHSVVMPGVTIGENSVVGAFSFVKEDIPANCIAYGIPAKVIKYKK
jgi:acetyltransferase-like isoleucine patch superfamily enzyme